MLAPQTPHDLQELFKHTGEPLPLVSAHRGGSKKNLPENCLATFENTLRHTFAVLEVDPRHTKELDKVARAAPGLDSMTLNEGIAYALSPGILHSAGGNDPLRSEVRRDIAANKPLTDNYTRFHRLGLALRPLLRDALNDEKQTLTTFLPRAVDAWRVAAELDFASGTAAAGKPSQRTIWYSAADCYSERKD